jgi:Homeodomain-like domain
MAQRDQVAALVAEGFNDCQIERATGIPRRTICDWRRRSPSDWRRSSCPVCEGTPERLPEASYAYLLGAYLGDGHLVHARRGVYRLRVACDLLHLNIAWWIALAIEDVRGRPAALHPRLHTRAVDVSSYWKH